MTTMASQITSLTVVYSTVYSDADQRKHQSSASLAFVWGTGELSAQRASYAENVSIWWRHHGIFHPWLLGIITTGNSNEGSDINHKIWYGRSCRNDIENQLTLIHWGRVTHICVGKLTSICSDNGLSPGRRQANIWTNAGILLTGPLGTNFSEILIEI